MNTASKIGEFKSIVIFLIMVMMIIIPLIICFVLSILDNRAYECLWDLLSNEDLRKEDD